MTGMVDGFLGFEIFNSRIFWGREIWRVFLCVASFKQGFK